MLDRKTGFILIGVLGIILVCAVSLFAVSRYQKEHGLLLPPPTALTPAQVIVPTVSAPVLTASPDSDPMHPVGLPLSDWSGIPVMPHSLNGQEFSDGGYSYTTISSVEDVQDYYLRELSGLGWQLFDIGFTEKGPASVGMFQNDVQLLNITIAPGDETDSLRVVILHLQ